MMDRTTTAITFAPEPEASSLWSRELQTSARRGPRMTAAELLRLLGDPAKSVGVDAKPDSAECRSPWERKTGGNRGPVAQ
jgi:hypothetical protein